MNTQNTSTPIRLPEGTVAHAEGNRIELVNHDLGRIASQEPIQFSGENADKRAQDWDYTHKSGHRGNFGYRPTKIKK